MKNRKDILRWDIRSRTTDKNVVDFPVEKYPLDFAAEHDEIIGDRGSATVNLRSKSVIARVSSDYQLVPHNHVLTAVESAFEANKINYELYDIHTGGPGGNRMYANYILPEYEFELKPGEEKHKPFIQVANSYDTTLEFSLITGFYRVACWNGNLWQTDSIEVEHLKHMYQNIKMPSVLLNVDRFLNQLGIVKVRFQNLLREPLSEMFIEDVLSSILKKPQREKFNQSQILQESLQELGNNQYALMNALTGFTTHIMADKNVFRSAYNYSTARDIQLKTMKVFQQQ